MSFDDDEEAVSALIAANEREFLESLPPLVRAAAVGDVPAVVRLLDEGVSVDQR
jgi:hypothetical protein